MRAGVHPLFYIFGIYFALTGKVFSFLTYTIVAVIHELGHSIVASRLGYRLNRIVLMPYGAVVSGEQALFSFADEITIAVAGPAVNVATAVLFIALWWVFPAAYPYTDVAVTASVTLAAINLLPCYPLDGGRILLAALSSRIDRKTALKTVRVLGIVASAALLALFIYSCFVKVNFSILFFSLFMLLGNFFLPKGCDYVRLFSGIDLSAVAKGRAIKKIAVTENMKIRSLYRFFGGSELTEIVVFSSDGKIKYALSADKAYKLISDCAPYSTVGEGLRKLIKP